ncbi:MAG: TadE/TadG family type IV pilus assembly protein [Pseudomonadota bacterium]
MRITQFSRLKEQARSFLKDRRGNAFVLFAVTLPIVIGAVGAAVDFSRGSATKDQLQAAMDAGVISAAKVLASGVTDERAIADAGRRSFDGNIEPAINEFVVPPIPSFSVDFENNVVSGDVVGTMKHLFPGTSKAMETKVAVDADASFGLRSMEVAMMLDITGSMRRDLDDLQDGSKAVIRTVLSANRKGDETRTRVAIVPYSEAVNLQEFGEALSGNPDMRCIVEREGEHAYKDTPPSLHPFTYPEQRDDLDVWDVYCPPNPVRPLTTNADLLEQDIDSFRTGGRTAGHLGTTWAYYTLSPAFNDIWPEGSRALPWNTEDHMKIAILMTDGSFNRYYDYDLPNGNTSWNEEAKRSNSATRNACAEMKRDNIIIFSIAFRAGGQAEEILRECATSGNYYYEPKSGDELVSAFRKIAGDVSDLRLIR